MPIYNLIHQLLAAAYDESLVDQRIEYQLIKKCVSRGFCAGFKDEVASMIASMPKQGAQGKNVIGGRNFLRRSPVASTESYSETSSFSI